MTAAIYDAVTDVIPATKTEQHHISQSLQAERYRMSQAERDLRRLCTAMRALYNIAVKTELRQLAPLSAVDPTQRCGYMAFMAVSAYYASRRDMPMTDAARTALLELRSIAQGRYALRRDPETAQYNLCSPGLVLQDAVSLFERGEIGADFAVAAALDETRDLLASYGVFV